MTDTSRVRVSIVGVVIVALFSALFARLWFLQMGADRDLKVVAIENSTRVVQTEMPRGRILDRNGKVLVENRRVWVVTVDRELPRPTRARVLGQLAELLETPKSELQKRYTDPRQPVLKPAIVAQDVPESAQIAILEHQESYPGVRVEKVTVRRYPQGPLAAQVLGYVGEISEEQLDERADDGYIAGDEIGRAGAERVFEKWLRGKPRRETVEVDPRGRQVGEPTHVEEGTVGKDVRLSIDVDVQRLAEETLAQAIPLARTRQNRDVDDRYETFKAPGGSVVVLDAGSGEIVAMASNPSYPPDLFVNGISTEDYTALTDPGANTPLLNRAVQGLYAPGSTFKLVSSVAMTRYGIRGAHDYYDDNGAIEIGGTVFSNAGGTAHGGVELSSALRVSSDTYFYTVGDTFWRIWKSGDEERGLGLAKTAKDFGFGKKTGVELDEQAGTVPDPKWKHDLSYAINDTEQAREENAVWYPADSIFTAVGQGGVTVTPLQLADAYAGFANHGRIWRPRLGLLVTDGDAPVHRFRSRVLADVPFDPDVWNTMNAGFVGVTQGDDGTASAAFAGFPFDQVPVAGKTGTAQVQGKGDTSLFAAYFPYNGRTYVAVAVVEEAGFGSEVAAPIVRRVIEGMTKVNPNPGPVRIEEGVRD
jgi:penicillin-binding protein 2